MGLPARATVTPGMQKKMVWAGSNLGSYGMAEEALGKLADQAISLGRIRRQLEAVGQERIAERDQAIAALKSMPLPERRVGLVGQKAPALAVVMMDGGRYQRRDHFGCPPTDDSAPAKSHWRESKVGCLLSMMSETFESDPCPDIPDNIANAGAIREFAKMAEITGPNEECSSLDIESSPTVDKVREEQEYEPPKRLSCEVVATSHSSDEFGWMLEARARQLNFQAAPRQAYVADGAKTNWRIQRAHFPRATPTADLMHALAYAWSAADVADEPDMFPKWAQLIWQGDVSEVIGHLRALQPNPQRPDVNPVPADRLSKIERSLTYFEKNCSHMNYPDYRRQGLPLTSARIESTIKLINRRIKGTEKFWGKETSESILQLCADYLSDSDPMTRFWARYHANQTGSNAYKNDSKICNV